MLFPTAALTASGSKGMISVRHISYVPGTPKVSGKISERFLFVNKHLPTIIKTYKQWGASEVFRPKGLRLLICTITAIGEIYLGMRQEFFDGILPVFVHLNDAHIQHF